MPKKQPIEPKPTQYGNILFRSRTEARWAVLLDFTPNVLNWWYEPETFKMPNGWTYTPDFLVKFCRPSGKIDTVYLEVKPSAPSGDWSRAVDRVVRRHNIVVIVAWADFYNNVGVQFRSFTPDAKKDVRYLLDCFSKSGQGYYHARHFRFDLE
jgi:hypothetical protein